MDGSLRREKIKERLFSHKNPISGSVLAEELGVSRQVIVQDIALLRAGGEGILSTAQGYVLMANIGQQKVSRIIACQHHNLLEMKNELHKIVDLGGTVIDVIVEHPLYGEIKANLILKNKNDVDYFVQKFSENKAEPLASLTNGIHLHTIEAENELILKQIELELDHMNVLLKN